MTKPSRPRLTDRAHSVNECLFMCFASVLRPARNARFGSDSGCTSWLGTGAKGQILTTRRDPSSFSHSVDDCPNRSNVSRPLYRPGLRARLCAVRLREKSQPGLVPGLDPGMGEAPDEAYRSNVARKCSRPSAASASWLFASGRQIETALAISRISGVKASITSGPS